jgi:class 3 adenylate cyclase
MASVRCAFAIADAARANPAGWQIRIGIHVGAVVAGVVGQSKFTFDLWGDTVNVAARLSDFGSEGAVYLSEAAWRRLDGRCRGQPLGLVTLKGKSAMEVYRCEGIDS